MARHSHTQLSEPAPLRQRQLQPQQRATQPPPPGTLAFTNNSTGTIDLAGCRLPDGRSSAMGRVGFAAGYLPLPAGLTVTETLELFGALYGVDDPSTRAASMSSVGMESAA